MSQILFVMDPLTSINIEKDTTYVMLQAAVEFYETVYVCTIEDLNVHQASVLARVQAFGFSDADTWFELKAPQSILLADMDMVLVRADPPFDSRYLYATQLLSLAQRHGAQVYNDPSALQHWNEKLVILDFPDLITETMVTSDKHEVETFLETHQQIVLKKLDSLQGKGVLKLSYDTPDKELIIKDFLQSEPKIMVQRFIPEIEAGDKRIILLHGEPIPYALARIPKAGDFRGNLAAGATGVVQPLSDRDKAICAELKSFCQENKLWFVGLDVIGDYLSEVNITSPTGIQEIMHGSDWQSNALLPIMRD